MIARRVVIAPLLIGAVPSAFGPLFVLIPLLFGPRSGGGSSRDETGGRNSGSGPATALLARSPRWIAEGIEFDRATGKLSDADYGSLKAAYTGRALAELRAPETPVGGGTLAADSSGSRSSTVRVSRVPPRTEADAEYCIICGRYLTGGVLTAVRRHEAAARYCSACGGALGAVAT